MVTAKGMAASQQLNKKNAALTNWLAVSAIQIQRVEKYLTPPL